MPQFLDKEIQDAYRNLVNLITKVPISFRTTKTLEGTGGKVSVSDIIAYQIGWGNLLISWYESGAKGKNPVMPGEGFATWDYKGLAKHFFYKYRYDQGLKQINAFEYVVNKIIKIVQKESKTGNLEKLNVWEWCTLESGKPWPLSKWVRINTVAPYRRASTVIRKYFKDLNKK